MARLITAVAALAAALAIAACGSGGGTSESSGSGGGKTVSTRQVSGMGRVLVDRSGRALYTFVRDAPGKVTGNGFRDAFGGRRFTWRAVTAGGGTSSQSGGSGGGSRGYGGGGY